MSFPGFGQFVAPRPPEQPEVYNAALPFFYRSGEAAPWFGLPGSIRVGGPSTYAMTNGRWVSGGNPCLVPFDMIITAWGINCTALANPSTCRPALVECDSRWRPQHILHQAAFDTSTTGAKTETGLSIVLRKGMRVHDVIAADGGSPTISYVQVTSFHAYNNAQALTNLSGTYWSGSDNTGSWPGAAPPSSGPWYQVPALNSLGQFDNVAQLQLLWYQWRPLTKGDVT